MRSSSSALVGCRLLLVSLGLAACTVSVKQPPSKPGAHPRTVTDEVAAAMSRTATEMVEQLNQYPGFTPQVDLDAPVALITWSFSEDGVLPHGGPSPVRGGSLAGDLTRAMRNTLPPDYWLIVTDATGEEMLYWTPINGPSLVRVEVPGKGEKREGEVKAVRNPAGRMAVRVPFHSGALAALFPAVGEDSIEPREILVFGNDLSSASDGRGRR